MENNLIHKRKYSKKFYFPSENITKIDDSKEENFNLFHSNKVDKSNIYLNELNHRFKNNLQLILSTIRIKQVEGKVDIKDIEDIITSISSSLNSLNANENKLDINLKEYLQEISNKLLFGQLVNIEIISNNFCFNIKKLYPIGIIVNEFITNSLKYAFINTESSKNKIKIIVIEKIDVLEIVLSDNGLGFNNQILNPSNKLKTKGLNLIKSFADQIEGNVLIHNNNGACITLSINKNYFY